MFWVDCFLLLCFRFVYIYSFLINEKVKSIFRNNLLSTSTWYQSLIFLGAFFFSLKNQKNSTTTLLNGFTLKILTIPSFQSISPMSPNCHPPIISHGAFKSNLFLKVMIFITLLMTLILYHHLPLPSLVLYPQIRHIQPRGVRIVSSLTLFLVLSPFHYNCLLPTPPLPLMHGKP